MLNFFFQFVDFRLNWKINQRLVYRLYLIDLPSGMHARVTFKRNTTKKLRNSLILPKMVTDWTTTLTLSSNGDKIDADDIVFHTWFMLTVWTHWTQHKNHGSLHRENMSSALIKIRFSTPPNGIGRMFTSNDEHLLLVDTYDVWQIA